MSFKELYKKKIAELTDKEARYERRVEALLLVEGNYCLQELIADMNDADSRTSWKIYKVIVEYINGKYGGEETPATIWILIREEVYEDKEEGYALWRNEISNKVFDAREGMSSSFNMADIYHTAATFIAEEGE